MSPKDPKKADDDPRTRNLDVAKAKAARLRLMKERNEIYLAEQRYEEWDDGESTRELRVLDH